MVRHITFATPSLSAKGVPPGDHMFPFWIEFEAAAVWQLVALTVVCLAMFTMTGLVRGGRF